MKKRNGFALVMAAALLILAACSGSTAPDSSAPLPSRETAEPAQPATQPEATAGTDSTDSPAGPPLSEEEIFEIFTALDQKAEPLLYLYLEAAPDAMVLGEESPHAPYYRVAEYSTIDEMKAATDAVFTADFTGAYFYDHAFADSTGGDTPLYKEIDGALYRNVDQGGMGWPHGLTDQYYVPYQDDSMIVLAVNTLLPGDELDWKNFLLRKQGGAWKIDSYYDFNPHMLYSDAPARQSEDELSNAVSSWFAAEDWTDANQLSANALVNFYEYAYLSEIKEYDYEKGYEVSAAELLDGLSVYLNGLRKETLTAINALDYASAHYDAATDCFYFDITFDPADFIVLSAETKGAVTTLEIMVIAKSGEASYTSFLDLEVNGTSIKYVGNRRS